MHWCSCASSTGTYADIYAVTPFEKFFQAFALIFFRVYFSLVAADISNMVTSARATIAEFKSKASMLESWMKTIKLDKKIQQRITKYYKYIWEKFKGIDENSIINDFPRTLKEEVICLSINANIKQIDLFPKDEENYHINLMKFFTFIAIPQNEFVYHWGEIATEIYFILEGTVALYAKERNLLVCHFEKDDYFGELSLIKTKPVYRAYAAKAVTNLSLAVLKASDLRRLCDRFPSTFETFENAMRKRAEELARREEKAKNSKNSSKGEKIFDVPEENEQKRRSQDGSDHGDSEFIKISEQSPLNRQLAAANTSSKLKRNTVVPVLKTPAIDYESQLKEQLSPIDPSIQNEVVTAQKGILQSNRNLLRQGMLGSHRLRVQKQEADKEFERFEEAINSMLEHPFSPHGLPTPTPQGRRSTFSPRKSVATLPLQTPGRTHEISIIKENSQRRNEGLLSVRSVTSARSDLRPIIQELGVNNETVHSEEDKDEEEREKTNNIAVIQSVEVEKEHNTKSRHLKSTITTRERCRKFFANLCLKLLPPNGRGRKCCQYFKNFYMKTRKYCIFLIYFWSVCFTPIILAFPNDVKYEGVTLALEIVATLVLTFDSILLVQKYLEGRARLMQVVPKDVFLGMSQSQMEATNEFENTVKSFNMSGPIPYLLWVFLQSFPWPLVFQAADVETRGTNWFLLLLQMIRLTHWTRILGIFKFEFFRNIAPRYQNMVISVSVFALINHLAGCIFIIIANSFSDFNVTWFATVPPPRPDWATAKRASLDISAPDMYLYSAFWAYVSSSHIGGDVRPCSVPEKFFNIFFVLLTTFTFAIFFGTVASLVESQVPIFKKEFQKNYRAATGFIKRCGFDQLQSQLDVSPSFVIFQNEILRSFMTISGTRRRESTKIPFLMICHQLSRSMSKLIDIMQQYKNHCYFETAEERLMLGFLIHFSSYPRSKSPFLVKK